MGGNLLHIFNLPPKRLSREEYFSLSEEISSRISKSYPGRFFITENYRNKESFGDLDCIIEIHPDFSPREWIINEFGITPHSNGKTHSIHVSGFQVDLSFINPKYFATSIFYYKGECGNLEGNVFKQMGLKHSHKGLIYCIRDSLFNGAGNNILEEFILTQNPEDICEIGGFDYIVRRDGFDTKEDLFNYIISSKYFNPEIFSYENLNHINRTRNRKRPVYAEFLQYIENKPTQKFLFKEKRDYLLDFLVKFPELGKRIEFFRVSYLESKEIKRKFNGDLVMQWTGIEDGKEIGKIMSRFRKEFPKEKLLTLSQNEIRSAFIENYARSL